MVSLLVGLTLLLTGCSPGDSQVTQDLEILLGSLTTKTFLQIMPAYEDPGWQQYIGSIGRRVAQASDRADFDYRFVVARSSEPNAFASPDGTIFVTTGLLRLIEYKEDAIAAILAHEVAHIALRHGRTRLAQEMGWRAALFAFFGYDQPAARVAANLTGALKSLGYGRELELAADSAAIRYLAKLHYPKDTMERLLVKISDLEKRKGAPIITCLSTHPPARERLEQLKKQ